MKPKTRRTTLTLSADSLAQAQRIARARNVSLSAVVSEAIVDGLRLQAAGKPAKSVLNAYRAAFSGFSDDELSVLNGVILQPAKPPKPLTRRTRRER